MEKPCRDIKKLQPLVQISLDPFLKACEQKGYKIGISETYRSKERQDYLYEQGRTRPGKIVTNAKGDTDKGYHQYGLALDIFQNIKGKEYDAAFLEKVGMLAEEYGFEWGGRWKSFVDRPHLQMTFGLTGKDIRNGKKPEHTISKKYLDALFYLYEKKEINQIGLWLTQKNITKNHIQALIIKFASKI